MAVSLLNIRGKEETLMVPMNEVKSCPWTTEVRYIATEGLNGCTAVAVTSELAGILAHIAPRTNAAAGIQNLKAVMQETVRHINTIKRQGLFPEPLSVVLAANYDDTIALPEQIDIIKRILDRLGVPIEIREYRVKGIGQARAEGETSLIIDGRTGRKPRIYVNDVLLEEHTITPDEREREAVSATPSVQQRTQHAGLQAEQVRMARERHGASGVTNAEASATAQFVGLRTEALHTSFSG